MALFIVLGVVVLITLVVLGLLFFLLGKEGQKAADEKPFSPAELKKTSAELTPLPGPKLSEDEVIPAFVPKVSLPTEEPQAPVEDDYKKRSQELEEELRTIKQHAEKQADVAREMIVNLNKENQSLKNQQTEVEEARTKLTEMQGEVSSLKTENVTLQAQLDSTNARVRLLEEEKVAVKIQMDQEITRVNATVDQLNREKEALLSTPKPAVDEGLQQELESLKSQCVALKQKCEELEGAQQKLSELNAQLVEKNEALKHDLIKARAQASGLERVSFNYKNQLEELLSVKKG